MARLVEAGADVRYVAFSIATRSLPEGFAPDTLAREVREATAELGIPPENLTVHDFDVRTFPDHRQEILELADRALERLAARRRLPAVAARHPPGPPDDRGGGAARLQAHDDPRLRDPLEQLRLLLPGVLRARTSATSSARSRRSSSYASQQHRRYANPEYVWNVARTHGINVNREYAEVFQVYRVDRLTILPLRS